MNPANSIPVQADVIHLAQNNSQLIKQKKNNNKSDEVKLNFCNFIMIGTSGARGHENLKRKENFHALGVTSDYISIIYFKYIYNKTE